MKPNSLQKRQFRSYTLNFGSQKARTTIITTGMSIAVMVVIVCVMAVQLIAGGGKGLAAKILHNISANSLRSLMAQEIPIYRTVVPAQTLAEATIYPKGLSNMLLYLCTDIDASNPLTLLGFQIPGLAVSDFKLLTPDPSYNTPPTDKGDEDSTPPPKLADDGTNKQPTTPPARPTPPAIPVGTKPVVYIYHSHNREAFLPDLPPGKTDSQAYDPVKNIENAGRSIVDELDKDGYPSMQTLVDYWTQGSFDNAYDYSRKTVQQVLGQQKDLKLIFDIHRDSLSYQFTTRELNGEKYASVYWIVGGHDNPHADKNDQLAITLNKYLEQMYPGLSRGVWEKNSAAYDTRYNQDLSPNMVLIEIGGPENSLAEVQRTSQALGKVFEKYLTDVDNLSPQVNIDKQTDARTTQKNTQPGNTSKTAPAEQQP